VQVEHNTPQCTLLAMLGNDCSDYKASCTESLKPGLNVEVPGGFSAVNIR
jgi:hypothetical protein